MIAKILMVDDEPDAEILFRQNFRREIRKGLYELMFAGSGDSALEILRTTEIPDFLVVLSDINMPGMTGLEFLDSVKEAWPDLPVIMISAYGDSGMASDAQQRGAATLLPKPVDFSQLWEKLSNIAERRAQ